MAWLMALVSALGLAAAPVEGGALPRAATASWKLLFHLQHPKKDTHLGCQDGQAPGTNPGACASACSSHPDCRFFYANDAGLCCLKAAYDQRSGVRTEKSGDFFQLTVGGPMDPSLATDNAYFLALPASGEPVYSCGVGSWAGATDAKLSEAPASPTLLKFTAAWAGARIQDPKVLMSSLHDSPMAEGRRWVDLSNGHTCGKLVYKIGTLTLFTHALMHGDVITDCSGSVVHEATLRPDLMQSRQFPGSRSRLRKSITPSEYRHAASAAQRQGSAKGVRRFSYGFQMTYMRDGNYQMFVVVCLSRLWYLQQLAAAASELGDTASGMPGKNDTMVIVVSGHQGGAIDPSRAAHYDPPAYVRNMIELVTASMPFKVKVVEEDVPLYFDYLWVPGVTNENWLPCFLGAPVGAPKETIARTSEVAQQLAVEARRDFDVQKTFVSTARMAELDRMRGEKIYIGRKDATDGAGRTLTNEDNLGDALADQGFKIVNTAGYSEQEKAYIFEPAKVVVLPLGAGMTNLIWAAPGCKVVVFCPPSMDEPWDKAGGAGAGLRSWNMCDYSRDWFVDRFLGHLHMTATVLRPGRVANEADIAAMRKHAPGQKSGAPVVVSSHNAAWTLRSVADTAAEVIYCATAWQGSTACAATAPVG